MRLPNKFISYKESILPKFVIVIEKIKEVDMTVLQLYRRMGKEIESVDEFIEVLDCLYALKKITFDGEVIHYVG